MKAAIFNYYRVETLNEALDTLSGESGYGKLLAGGQSLGPMMNMRLVRPDFVVDLCGVESLKSTDVEGEFVRIGSRVTHSEIEDGTVSGATGKYLAEVARGIAYRAVRNCGTMGGSVVHADPAADWISALIAADANVVIVYRQGQHLFKLSDFIRGPFTTGIGEEEILSFIEIPKLTDRARWSYLKSCRKPGEFAQAIAVALRDENAGTFRLVAGAMNSAPKVTECSLSGPSEEEIGALIMDREGYQRDMHFALLKRAIGEVLA